MMATADHAELEHLCGVTLRRARTRLLDGEVIDVGLDFADGTELILGCAGSGAIWIGTGEAAGGTTDDIVLEGIAGPLVKVAAAADDGTLVFRFERGTLRLVNEDDELSVMVDEEPDL